MNGWQKIEILSKVVAAVLIPLAIAWLANEVSLSNKQRDAEIKFVEIASAILNREPAPNQSGDSKSLRSWAVQVLDKYSGVKMSDDTKNALVQSQSLPTATTPERTTEPAASGDTWGLVFGGDATLDAAQHETTVTAKRMGLSGTAIFRRAGSFRSVRVFTNRSEAEDALGRARSVRLDAYVINMSKWCPSSVERKGYFECASP